MQKKFKVVILMTLLLSFMLVGCGDSKIKDFIVKDNGVYIPGTYRGEAESHGGVIIVEVTVDENKITQIDFVDFNDAIYSEQPSYAIAENIIKANSTNIDTITGATETTKAVIVAVDDALENAYVDDIHKDEINKTYEVVVEYEDINTDVLVIGGGIAGLTASIEASESGADVLLIEKMTFLGGNANYAVSGLNAVETREQKTLYIHDSVETFFDDTMKYGKNLNDVELVKRLTSESNLLIRWFETKGIIFTEVEYLSGSTNNRAHRPGQNVMIGNYLIEELTRQLEINNVQTKLGTKAEKIIVEDNEVVGAVVSTTDGQTYNIYADAIVIATGGFSANNEMVVKYRPEFEGYGTTNSSGSTGDIFEIVDGLDVEFIDLDQIQSHPTVMPLNNYTISEIVRNEGGILVNRNGVRFVNELGENDEVSKAIIDQNNGSAFLVFDQNIRENTPIINSYYKKGYLMEADDIAILAERIEVPRLELVNTVTQYNRAVETKVDSDFKRQLMKTKINKAPFYVVEVAPAAHYTMGGLKIDKETRVYKTNGEYIEGLYAAGEVTGGVHGASRLSGNGLTDSGVFGRVAGANAGEFALTN